MNVHILLWENTNSGDEAKYSPAAGDPMRLSRKMEEAPTVRVAGVSSEAPKWELGEFGLLALSVNQDQAQRQTLSPVNTIPHTGLNSVYICLELATNLGLPQMILKALHVKYAKGVTSFSRKETYLQKATAL